MKRAEFDELWTVLLGSFPNAPRLGDLHETAYFSALEKFHVKQVAEGFRRFIEESGSKFFPSCPELMLWVNPKKSQTDKAFEEAAKRATAREEVVFNAMEAYLNDHSHSAFVRVFCHDTDRFMDVWDWTSPEKANEMALTKGSAMVIMGSLLLSKLKDGTLSAWLGHSDILHHLHNLARTWIRSLPAQRAQKLIGAGS